MEDQIWSPEKYSMKNSYNKNTFYLNKRNTYMMKILLTECKFILTVQKHKNTYVMKYTFILIESKCILIP